MGKKLVPISTNKEQLEQHQINDGVTSGTAGQVLEFHPIYHFLLALVVSMYTTVHVAYLFTGRYIFVKVRSGLQRGQEERQEERSDDCLFQPSLDSPSSSSPQFSGWVALPLALLALGLSILLQPRNQKKPYKIFLSGLFLTIGVVPQFCLALGVVKYDIEDKVTHLGVSGVRLFFWSLIYITATKVRSKIARLQDDDLSSFLSRNLFLEGFVAGVGQLGFLMFDVLRCLNELGTDWRFGTTTGSNGLIVEKWTLCRRTMCSQPGLGGLINIYIFIKLFSSLVPKRILERHSIPYESICTLDLTRQQLFQCFCVTISLSAAMYLLGYYGT